MPEKILIASREGSSGIGGLASYQRGLADALQTAGFAPEFCAMQAGIRGSNFPVHTLTSHTKNDLRRLWAPFAHRRLFHYLLQMGIETQFAPEIRRLAESDWRAVHYVGTGWDIMGFAMHALARKRGVPFTVWPAVHPGVWGDDEIDLRLYKLADTVFCQSRHEAEHLAQRGLDRARATLSGLPPMCRTDGAGPALRRRLGLGQRPSVFFLGRRDTGKGYPLLLEAWQRVSREFPEAVLLLAGPGDLESEKLAALPPDSFRDMGVPDEQEKTDAYAACDLFCLPSSHESFGIVFVEAWSYGKPVICGTAPATREWVKDGVTGLWSDADASSISEKILYLLRNGELRSQMGSAGQKFQRSALTWDSVVSLHLQAFGLKPQPHG